MTQHHMEIKQDAAGDWRWTIWESTQDIVGTSIKGFDSEKACLHNLFGIFFGTWDESFLELYAKWMEAGGEYAVPPEAAEGVNVRVEPKAEPQLEFDVESMPVEIQRKADAPDPEQHMEQLLAEKAAEHGQQG